MTITDSTKRFYRLRAPAAEGKSVAVSVRVDDERGDLYVGVGSGSRRMYLTPAEAWALWRCLSEAVASLGDPPESIRTAVYPTRR